MRCACTGVSQDTGVIIRDAIGAFIVEMLLIGTYLLIMATINSLLRKLWRIPEEGSFLSSLLSPLLFP